MAADTKRGAVRAAVLECCRAWEPQARVLGNVTAGELADLLEHVVTAADKAVTEETAALAEELLGHLDYCGWGDSWERECSESLRERATAWLARRREAAK